MRIILPGRELGYDFLGEDGIVGSNGSEDKIREKAYNPGRFCVLDNKEGVFWKNAVRFWRFVRHYYKSCDWELLLNGDLEKKLVKSCRCSDRVAYAELVRAYSGRVFGICLGMVGNSHDAEDIAQQALLKGFADIKQLGDNEKFGAWICRIARNLCIDFIRRQQRGREVFAKRATAIKAGSEEFPELASALAKLSEDYRIALMLYYFEGRSGETIAESLGLNKDVVYKRISRARKQLRKLLEAERGQ